MCQDAPSFGRLDSVPKTCAQAIETYAQAVKITPEAVCSVLSHATLTQIEGGFAQVHMKYMPPSGYDANTTTGMGLCKATCGALAQGPCWLRGAVDPWCEPT